MVLFSKKRSQLGGSCRQSVLGEKQLGSIFSFKSGDLKPKFRLLPTAGRGPQCVLISKLCFFGSCPENHRSISFPPVPAESNETIGFINA
jgi:hypothetical protein